MKLEELISEERADELVAQAKKYEGRWDSSVFIYEALRTAAREAALAMRERCAAACEKVYPPIHTYASENSDRYRTQDETVHKCAAAIRGLDIE